MMEIAKLELEMVLPKRQSQDMHLCKTVLLVEDNYNIRLIAGISLKQAFCVLTATAGQEALAMAEAEKPDIILLDVNMPGMDGLQVLTRLKDNPVTANIPVVLLTACVQVHELEEFWKLDVAGIIKKPFDPLTLPAEITTLIETG